MLVIIYYRGIRKLMNLLPIYRISHDQHSAWHIIWTHKLIFTEWIGNVKEGNHENIMYPIHGSICGFIKLLISEDEKKPFFFFFKGSAGCTIAQLSMTWPQNLGCFVLALQG